MHLLFADLEQDIARLAIRTVLYAAVVLGVATLLAVLLKQHKALKLPLFAIMAITIIGSTGLLMSSTVYLNTKSESGGPVHWHADIEFWACGAELELRDPNGTLSNKVGSSTYHEHNDKRIHLEGVVVRKAEDASLEKFMRVSGGYLTKDRIAIPLNTDRSTWYASAEKGTVDGDSQSLEGYPIKDPDASLADGSHYGVMETEDGPLQVLANSGGCRYGDAQTEAEVQAFVYSFDKASNTYSQQKLGSPMDYLMRDEPLVPPGDCLIIEYGQPKDRTDKLCRQYGVRDAKRCVEFGVKAYDPGLCNIREVSEGGE